MDTFVEYVREGVWHIWIGFDHILFLISLLLPAVYVRHEQDWNSAEAFRPVWKSVLKVVTMFTLAHTITLWLAVMEYVALPSQFELPATSSFESSLSSSPSVKLDSQCAVSAIEPCRSTATAITMYESEEVADA